VGGARLTSERLDDLLDRTTDIFVAEGFVDLKVADLARRLSCSPGTLYRLAASKEDLALIVVSRWIEKALSESNREAGAIDSPKGRARAYYNAMTRRVAQLSPQFRLDIDHFDATKTAWDRRVVEFVDQFAEYVDAAASAGEVRPVNPRFMALLIRQMAVLTRNDEVLATCGMTRDDALREIDTLIWEGISR